MQEAMTTMDAVTRDVRIEKLAAGDTQTQEAVVRLLLDAFGDAVRYGEERIRSQLQPSSDVFYRQFFVALRGEEVVGAGGMKGADWASDTHLLYLSAVASDARGQGVAKALVQARISWVEHHFEAGRILVSTRHKKRFAKLGFRSFSEDGAGERNLIIREFGSR
jgi:GNAT superfamily N-acetyltransferase